MITMGEFDWEIIFFNFSTNIHFLTSIYNFHHIYEHYVNLNSHSAFSLWHSNKQHLCLFQVKLYHLNSSIFGNLHYRFFQTLILLRFRMSNYMRSYNWK